MSDYVGKHMAPEHFVPDVVVAKANAELSARLKTWLCTTHVDVEHNEQVWRVFPMDVGDVTLAFDSVVKLP